MFFAYSFLTNILSASNGVVIATENKHKSILYDEHSVNKVEMITAHIGKWIFNLVNLYVSYVL